MKTVTSRILFVLILACFTSATMVSQVKPKAGSPHTAKVNAGQPYVLMDANNLTSWVRSDGNYPALTHNEWNGEFPKGSGVGTVYQEGIVFGGKVFDGLYSDSIRITGNTYFTGMQPGSILVDQSGKTVGAEDPSNLSTRAYAVRADMPPTIEDDTASWPDLKVDAAAYYQKDTSQVSSQEIRDHAAQYFADWREWPAAKGAPWFVDSVKVVRNDAAFDPNNPHDIPGIPDAAETIWYVCNDEDPNVTAQFAGSPPIGIEEQVTLWAFHNLSPALQPLDNVIFKQVKLIYKGNVGANSNSHIDSLFICQWVDGDIGDAGDDYGGSDSLMNLGFEYNSTTTDNVYSSAGLMTPSDGFLYVNGSATFTGSQADSAIIDFQWRKGYRYNYERPMTSIFIHQTGTANSDPDNATYSGTLQWFNVFRNCMFRPQYPAGNPLYVAYNYPSSHHIVTSYFMSGDPVTGTGWIDGLDMSAGDRRFWSMHGPISLRLHDTAEVEIAHVAALGADNIASLQILKYYASYAKYVYTASVSPSTMVTSVAGREIVPRAFTVAQNYPNPFNPSTAIEFDCPNTTDVKIEVNNTTGQKIQTLLNKKIIAGNHQIKFNAQNFSGGV